MYLGSNVWCVVLYESVGEWRGVAGAGHGVGGLVSVYVGGVEWDQGVERSQVRYRDSLSTVVTRSEWSKWLVTVHCEGQVQVETNQFIISCSDELNMFLLVNTAPMPGAARQLDTLHEQESAQVEQLPLVRNSILSRHLPSPGSYSVIIQIPWSHLVLNRVPANVWNSPVPG